MTEKKTPASTEELPDIYDYTIEDAEKDMFDYIHLKEKSRKILDDMLKKPIN